MLRAMRNWLVGVVLAAAGCGSTEYTCTPQCSPPGQTSVIGGNSTISVSADSQADAEKQCKTEAESDSNACPAEYTVVSCICSSG